MKSRFMVLMVLIFVAALFTGCATTGDLEKLQRPGQGGLNEGRSGLDEGRPGRKGRRSGEGRRCGCASRQAAQANEAAAKADQAAARAEACREAGRGQREEVRGDLHEIHEEVEHAALQGIDAPAGANEKGGAGFHTGAAFFLSCSLLDLLLSLLLTLFPSSLSRLYLHGRPGGNESPDLLDLAVCQGDAAVGPVEEVLDIAHPEFILFHPVDHDAVARRHPQ